MQINFIRDFYNIKNGTSIDLDQSAVNILVGENGAGKTTFLKSLERKRRNRLLNKYFTIDGMSKQSIIILNSESFRSSKSYFVDSPREVHLNKLQQKSHGEAWKTQIDSMKQRCRNDSFIIMDEPETSLSIESQLELCEWFLEIKDKYAHIGAAISTHSLVIIEMLGDHVIELPYGIKTTASEYVKSKSNRIQAAKNRIINKR